MKSSSLLAADLAPNSAGIVVLVLWLLGAVVTYIWWETKSDKSGTSWSSLSSYLDFLDLFGWWGFLFLALVWPLVLAHIIASMVRKKKGPDRPPDCNPPVEKEA